VEIDVRTQEQVKIIKLRGKLNLGASLDRTDETLKDLVNAGESRFLLDLQEVPMIDSSGIGLLVRYLTAAKQRGGTQQSSRLGRRRSEPVIQHRRQRDWQFPGRHSPTRRRRRAQPLRGHRRR